MSCKFHLCSEQSRGLFNRVIIQSGGGLNAGDPTRPAVEMCSITERSLLSAGWTPEDLLEKDAQELTDALGNAAMSLMEGKELFIFQPCIDGSFLKELPEKTISEGTYNTDADIICGTVNGDSWMFTRKVRKQLENNPEALHAFSFAPGVSWGRHQIHTGRKPIYSYYFERDQGNGVAPHASEIPYIFGTLECRPGPNSEIDHKLSEAMSDYWCNFAKNGNPNGSGLEEWPLYTEKTPYVMHFKNDAWNAENIAEDPESIHVMDYTEAHPGMLESLDGFID